MSPSKSKAKSSARAAKDQKASTTKSVVIPATSSHAGSYDPGVGTFHVLETSSIASSTPDGRIQSIDDSDLHSGSLVNGAEYDSVSNHDSCSGESEDQKDKAATVNSRQEAIPGCDNDKRDKIRQKNERKHQRQRERRAQELHERCSGYLMSRKLEVLAQQLVAMGFSYERATLALILNEGRVEESVAWLFEAGEGAQDKEQCTVDAACNLKIDITEELARIIELETKLKCTKQEVERAVVSCEGDLDKAAEALRMLKQESTSSPPKVEGTSSMLAIDGSKRSVSGAQVVMERSLKSIASVTTQHRRDAERDFNYTKSPPGAVPLESVTNLQPSRKVQSISNSVKPQALPMPVEKRWATTSTSHPVSYSLASPQLAKGETMDIVLGNAAKISTTVAGREPVVVPQRPHVANMMQNLAARDSATFLEGWHPSNMVNAASQIPTANVTSMTLDAEHRRHLQQEHLRQLRQHRSFTGSHVDRSEADWTTSWAPSGLSEPSSLGLFTGWGSTRTSGSTSPVDWSVGDSILNCDYNHVDWSLESTFAGQGDLWKGFTSFSRQGQDGWWPSTSRVAASGDASSSNGLHEWTSPFAVKDLFTVPRQFVTSPLQ